MLSLAGDDTIVPPPVDTAERRAIAELAGLAPGVSTQLAMGPVIGEGGMGVIRSAEQVALGRTVAVKTLKPGRADGTAIRDLLHEAWVTGAIEHPGVVPVHALELDADGVPLIVLKRVDGVAWSKLIASPGEVATRFGATDLLAWNLGILVRVLDAVRFAHRRGIVHRDLKPANVMIGDFGEVYLLDWGIAVSLRDDGRGRLPLASRVNRLAGTPGYMAPEMLGRDGDVLSERTDVYLAGAVLYELICGRPPHAGADALAVVSHIISGELELPATAPGELVGICRHAMAADPAERFESAQALQLAIQHYLEHRGSAELAARATANLARLREHLASSPRDDIYRWFGACRFGFHEALAAWRDNAEARAGLVEATTAVADYELAHDNPQAALALLGDIEAPTELAHRVQLAVDARARRQAELERVHRDADASIHRGTRLAFGLALGALFTAIPLLNARFGAAERDQGLLGMIGLSAALAIIVGAVGWRRRETLGSTAVNRRALAAIVVLFASQVALGVGALLLGIPLIVGLTFTMLLWSIVAAMHAIHVDRKFAPNAVFYLIAFLLSANWPDLRAYMSSSANLLLALNAFRIWRASSPG
jgi:hypothetical protein